MVALSGLAVIGMFIWWSLRDVSITRATFNALLKQIGIAYEVPDTCFRSAFLKAVREVQANGRGKYIIRKIYKRSDEYCFGLVDEQINTRDKTLGYNHSANITFNPSTGNLSVDFRHAAADDIQDLYTKYRDVMDADDVREAIMGIIKSWRVVSVRGRGGIYFVPAKFESEVAKLETLIEGLGSECTLAVAPQVDAEKSKKAIYKAFVTGLKDKIAAFESEVETDALSRESAWENRIAEFKALKEEISFYQEAMSFQADDLAASLDKLTEKVREKIAS